MVSEMKFLRVWDQGYPIIEHFGTAFFNDLKYDPSKMLDQVKEINAMRANLERIEALITNGISNEMISFLIEIGKKVHKELVHALDFCSMDAANHGSELGRIVYYATKKDVVEKKRKKAWEALINKDVMRFAIEHFNDLPQDYYGDYTYLRRYLELCQKEVEK